MILDHIGIVVSSLEDGIEQWQRIFGYDQDTDPVHNTRQKVKVVFLKKPGSLPVKLIAPAEPSSPISAFAKRGGGLHHLCFMCDDLDVEMDSLERQGLRILVPPQPGEAFENERIAFVYAGQGLNIELIDTNKRAKRRSLDHS